jgi:hypothetical protein
MGTNTAQAFISQIARLTMNRECSTCGKDGDDPNIDCDAHEPFKMECEDAVETVHSLVARARELASSE